MATRLYAILARKAPLAVVFRRGPSKRVLCLLWHLDTDRLEEGQWLSGRIFERRADLSPSGRLLAYFAANHRRGGPGTWTAVSRPPWLTALALWPKGDTWGGGALFEDERTLLLNHAAGVHATPAPGQEPPRGLVVRPLHDHAGRGEDAPIHPLRLARDGWRLVQDGREQARAFGAKVWIVLDPPRIFTKPQGGPGRRSGVELDELLHGVKERDGAWYVTEHRLVHRASGRVASLGKSDWADWDHTGDLLFAKDGALHRLHRARAAALEPEAARRVADLSGLRFVARASPAEARRWPR